jgi:hypothetical protein
MPIFGALFALDSRAPFLSVAGHFKMDDFGLADMHAERLLNLRDAKEKWESESLARVQLEPPILRACVRDTDSDKSSGAEPRLPSFHKLLALLEEEEEGDANVRLNGGSSVAHAKRDARNASRKDFLSTGLNIASFEREDTSTEMSDHHSNASTRESSPRPEARSRAACSESYDKSEGKRARLSRAASSMLREWFDQHKSWPYPTFDDVQRLSWATGATVVQVRNWFMNSRRTVRKRSTDCDEYPQQELSHGSKVLGAANSFTLLPAKRKVHDSS